MLNLWKYLRPPNCLIVRRVIRRKIITGCKYEKFKLSSFTSVIALSGHSYLNILFHLVSLADIEFREIKIANVLRT